LARVGQEVDIGGVGLPHVIAVEQPGARHKPRRGLHCGHGHYRGRQQARFALLTPPALLCHGHCGRRQHLHSAIDSVAPKVNIHNLQRNVAEADVLAKGHVVDAAGKAQHHVAIEHTALSAQVLPTLPTPVATTAASTPILATPHSTAVGEMAPSLSPSSQMPRHMTRTSHRLTYLPQRPLWSCIAALQLPSSPQVAFSATPRTCSLPTMEYHSQTVGWGTTLAP
jgi:hypothetical protein